MGRRANVEGLALENAGVQLENGHIKVNEHMQTTAENIYAAGDVADGWMLAHTAYDEAMCAAKKISSTATIKCLRGQQCREWYSLILRWGGQ